MKCPICTETDLVMAERQGVEIDYCPKCRGVWLDRGELDKIIEKSVIQPQQPQQPQNMSYGYDTSGHGHDEHNGGYGDKRHRKRSWLGELFD
jgi:Zn-finger nucleic acid-binding protein